MKIGIKVPLPSIYIYELKKMHTCLSQRLYFAVSSQPRRQYSGTPRSQRVQSPCRACRGRLWWCGSRGWDAGRQHRSRDAIPTENECTCMNGDGFRTTVHLGWYKSVGVQRAYTPRLCQIFIMHGKYSL